MGLLACMGMPQRGKSERGLYRVPRCWSGWKRCARLIQAGKQNKDVLKYTQYKDIS